MSHFYATMTSPLGEIALTSFGEALTGLYIPGQALHTQAKKGVHAPKLFKQVIQQLTEYFDGTRSKFDLPLAADGTEFQKRVWRALCGIHCGETKSYGEIAKSLKNPNAARAVGLANSQNPICIIVPCHRVIGVKGRLIGYAGGLKAKKWLLDHEKNFKDKIVINSSLKI